MKLGTESLVYLFGFLAIVGIGTAGYFVMVNTEQAERITALTAQREALATESEERQQALNAANDEIAELENEIDEFQEELEELADDYRDERNRNEEFEDQIRDLAGTLGDLEKLDSIDEELLAKYSKVYFLNENYIPERLTQIEEDWVAEGKGDEYFHARAYKHLEDLMESAEDDGIDLKIVSAYRSFDEQGEIKGLHTQVYGEGANTFSADQGYSEHQLGTTVDFSTPAIGNQLLESFEDTPEFEWLEENAHKYGFILSYPEGNQFYIYEPWHWRFVSTELARDLERRGDTFYEMEQREINRYLLEFFD